MTLDVQCIGESHCNVMFSNRCTHLFADLADYLASRQGRTKIDKMYIFHIGSFIIGIKVTNKYKTHLYEMGLILLYDYTTLNCFWVRHKYNMLDSLPSLRILKLRQYWLFLFPKHI